MSKSNRRRCRGFTLVEALLSIVVIGVVTVAVGEMMISGMNTYRLVVDRREALQEARLAVNLMTRELQDIARPNKDITAISPASMTFVPATGESVTYSVVGGDLLRDTKTLASHVTANTGFQYYTGNGAVTADPTKVHRVHLAVEVDTGVGAHGKVMINSSVYLRNRYYDGFTQI